MMELTETADAILHLCEDSGLTPEGTATVAAAVLCAVTVDVKTAHDIVDAIDRMAQQAEEGGANNGMQ